MRYVIIEMSNYHLHPERTGAMGKDLNGKELVKGLSQRYDEMYVDRYKKDTIFTAKILKQ